ncbi:unnamed protein product [Tenebrio molitor]|nr:unnamed protein product [Tenebrio molitor]
MDIAKGTKLVCNIWMISGLPIYKLRNGKFKCTISKSFIFPLAFLIINIACVVKFQKFTNELHCSITILQFSTLYLLDFVQILHKNFHEAVKNNMKENIAIDFQQIVQIYDLLQKIFIDINNTFQKPILLKIFNDFIHAVTISFYTLSTLSELTPMTTYVIILIAAAIWLTETLISIFVIAYYFEGISEQANLMMELFDDLSTNSTYFYPRFYKSKILLELKVKQTSTSFHVCGLFPLNCSFVYMMIAGLTTYVLYLVQFSQIKR